ncbi:LysR family transcriptional regulator [Sorangium sp. So ce887]|uniref:LysR family transcriptional regulator n=1 Tax=Sorangium sp. So ce887 TaxID=3133324 RepID=UPI003F60E5FB
MARPLPVTRGTGATARQPLEASLGLNQWDDIRYFLSVVRCASFSGAARALGTDQSTVSRRIALLERTLGRTLFERGARTVRRTSHGEALVEAALAVERAVLALEDTARHAEDTPRGRVRIALTEGLAQHVVVPAVLPALLSAHPELAIDLRTGDDVADLARHEADVALRFFRTPRGDLVGQRVARLPLAVLGARAQQKRLARMSARELPWTAYVRDGLETAESQWLAQLGVARPRIECSSVETQLAAVRTGLGVAVAPRALTQVMPGLVALNLPGLPELGALEVFVVTRAALRRVPRVAVVYDALVRAMRALGEAPEG